MAEPTPNLILTGFMGTGKTTVGRILSDLLDMEFVDSDALIESRHGPIPSIFAERGETGFRDLERELAAELAGSHGLVIATGGRMMLDEVNVARLGRTGQVFCLTADADEIVARIGDDQSRPLLEGDDRRQRIVDLLRERGDGYSRFTQIATDGITPDAVAGEIARRWRGE
jgi:shikimate kinase